MHEAYKLTRRFRIPVGVLVACLALVGSVASPLETEPQLAGDADGIDAARAKGDELNIDGMWRPDAATFAGQPYPEQMLRQMSLEIRGETYEVNLAGTIDRGTIVIDATATPARLDVTGTDGPNKGKTYPAIFKIDGDRLEICYELGGGDRPAEFGASEGTQRFLVSYRRIPR